MKPPRIVTLLLLALLWFILAGFGVAVFQIESDQRQRQRLIPAREAKQK